MKYVSVSEARKRFASLVDGTERKIVLRNNEPVAAILSFDDFEALVAAQVRERDPEHLARLAKAHARVQAGDYAGLVDFSAGDADDLLALAHSMLDEEAGDFHEEVRKYIERAAKISERVRKSASRPREKEPAPAPEAAPAASGPEKKRTNESPRGRASRR